MSFVVSSGQLLKHLKSINGIISSNPIVPILENFKFEAGNGVLRTTASDLHTTIVSEVAVESTQEGQLAVPAKILIEILSNIPEQPVRFSIDEDTYSLNIKTENGSYKISGENAIDFPKIPKLSGASTFTMEASILCKAIATTSFAASTDELRPAMTGVYFQLDSDESHFVSTDGHRLVKYTREDISSKDPVNFIVPRKSLQFLKNIVPTDSTVVEVAYTPQSACFTFGSTQIFCRLIDERFPDYQAAIPVQNPNILTIDRLELLGAMRRVSVFTSKSHSQVRLKLTPNTLTLSAEDLEYSNEANEKLQCDYEGEGMEIGFNAKMVVEMLSNIESNLVSVEMSTPTRPGLIVPHNADEGEKTIMLVMPIMLASYSPM